MLARSLEIARGNQQLGQIIAGLVVLRLQFYRAGKLQIRGRPLLYLQVAQGQPIMSLRKTLVDLNGIEELNGGFPILALLKIFLPTFEIFLFPNIGIPRACGKDKS